MDERPESAADLDAVIANALTNTALAGCRVAQLMTRAIRALRPDQPIQDAIDLFAGDEFHHIPVADGAALVGVISDRDVLRALLRSDTTVDGPVSHIMRTRPLTTAPDTTVGEAARLLLSHHINSLPVVDAAGNLVGMLTTTDLLRGVLAG